MDACGECGYDYAALERSELPSTIRSLANEHGVRLAHRPLEHLRIHARPGVWSVLEYACHVRDVLAVQRERIGLALAEDAPAFSSMRREERVTEERYNEQAPDTVRGELVGAADRLARALEGLNDGEWHREGRYNWPVPAMRDVEWIARHTVHELVHHLRDVDGQLADDA